MKRLRWMIPWLAGVLAAALLFAGLAAVFGLRYENSDDMLFVKGFMGFEGGKPVSFTLYTHTFLAWLLYGLSAAVPNMAWFSLFQLGLLFFSVTVIVKAAVRMGGWRGLLGGLIYAGVFAAFACSRLSYTTTAALAGAATVMQLMEYGRAPSRPVLAWAVILFLCAYSLRQMTALPILAYCLLVLCWQGVKAWRAHQPITPAVRAAVVLCGLLALFAGVREWEITACGERDTLEWQQSRIELFDYTGFEQNIAPALAADTGLTETQTRLVQQWYFWDEQVDAEAFQTLTAAYADEAKESVWKKLSDYFQNNPRYLCAAALLLTSLVWILIGRRSRWDALAALLSLAGGFVMLIYLCWRGRVLFRGLDVVFFPCGALLLALALLNPPRKKASLAALAALMLLLTGADAYFTADVLDAKPDWGSQQREAELERFALSHPDKLIVRTPNLLRDTRLLPNVSDGTPRNIAIWGDWYCRMPGWRYQLKQYGFDPEHFSLADWISEVLLFATNEDSPPQLLLDGITEALGSEVSCEMVGEEGTLRFFAIRKAQP